MVSHIYKRFKKASNWLTNLNNKTGFDADITAKVKTVIKIKKLFLYSAALRPQETGTVQPCVSLGVADELHDANAWVFRQKKEAERGKISSIEIIFVNLQKICI